MSVACTCSNVVAPKSMTVERLREMIEAIPPIPDFFGDLMRSHGFDPAVDFLLISGDVAEEMGAIEIRFLPEYVRIHWLLPPLSIYFLRGPNELSPTIEMMRHQ